MIVKKLQFLFKCREKSVNIICSWASFIFTFIITDFTVVECFGTLVNS